MAAQPVPGPHTAVEAGNGCQASGMQIHSWRGWPQCLLGDGAQPQESMLACGARAAEEVLAGCQCSSWPLAWAREEAAGAGGWCQQMQVAVGKRAEGL